MRRVAAAAAVRVAGRACRGRGRRRGCFRPTSPLAGCDGQGGQCPSPGRLSVRSAYYWLSHLVLQRSGGNPAGAQLAVLLSGASVPPAGAASKQALSPPGLDFATLPLVRLLEAFEASARGAQGLLTVLSDAAGAKEDGATRSFCTVVQVPVFLCRGCSARFVSSRTRGCAKCCACRHRRTLRFWRRPARSARADCTVRACHCSARNSDGSSVGCKGRRRRRCCNVTGERRRSPARRPRRRHCDAHWWRARCCCGSVRGERSCVSGPRTTRQPPRTRGAAAVAAHRRWACGSCEWCRSSAAAASAPSTRRKGSVAGGDGGSDSRSRDSAAQRRRLRMRPRAHSRRL